MEAIGTGVAGQAGGSRSAEVDERGTGCGGGVLQAGGGSRSAPARAVEIDESTAAANNTGRLQREAGQNGHDDIIEDPVATVDAPRAGEGRNLPAYNTDHFQVQCSLSVSSPNHPPVDACDCYICKASRFVKKSLQ